MCVYGVLGARRGGGLRAVAAGAVQRVSAPPGGVRIQRAQRERQLIPGRAGLAEGKEKNRKCGHFLILHFFNVVPDAIQVGSAPLVLNQPYLPGRRHGPGSLPVVDLLWRGQQAVLRRSAPSSSQLAGGAHAVLEAAHQPRSVTELSALKPSSM